MKTKKLIRYRVSVSVKFPATHHRKGEDTYFAQKIRRNIDCKKCHHELCDNCGIGDVWNKLHTIRGNYELWQKRLMFDTHQNQTLKGKTKFHLHLTSLCKL